MRTKQTSRYSRWKPDIRDSVWYRSEREVALHELSIKTEYKFPIPSPSDNNLPNLPLDVVIEIFILALSLLPMDERKAWFLDICTLSKYYCEQLNHSDQFHARIGKVFLRDRALIENFVSAKHMSDAPEACYLELEYEMCSWNEFGEWKGMHCQPCGNFPAMSPNLVSHFLMMQKDLTEFIYFWDFAIPAGSHTRSTNQLFFIRRSPFQLTQSSKDRFEYDQDGEEMEPKQKKIKLPESVDANKIYDSSERVIFWTHFCQTNSGAERFLPISEFPCENDPKITAAMKGIEAKFEKNFPGKHFLYLTSDHIEIIFFVGETEDYYMGFWMMGETSS
jgi:hypothetical protein